MKKQYLKHTLIGFFTGAAVFGICAALIFLALGAVGLSSPMMTAVAGIFIPIGAAAGHLFAVCKNNTEDSYDNLFTPVAAYFAGVLAMALMHLLYPARSFWLGTAVMIAVVALVYLYIYKRTPVPERGSQARGKLYRSYAVHGFAVSLVFALLVWNIVPFFLGVMVTAAAVVFTRRRLNPLPDPELRPQEVKIAAYLEPDKAENSFEPAKTKKKSHIKLIFILVLILFVAALSAWRYTPEIGLVTGGCVLLGIILGTCISFVKSTGNVKN